MSDREERRARRRALVSADELNRLADAVARLEADQTKELEEAIRAIVRHLGITRELVDTVRQRGPSRPPTSSRRCSTREATMSDGAELRQVVMREVDYYPQETQPEVANAVLRAIVRHLGITRELVDTVRNHAQDMRDGATWAFEAAYILQTILDAGGSDGEAVP